MNCPKCFKPLEVTETESFWCVNGCYESEYYLWVDLKVKGGQGIGNSDSKFRKDNTLREMQENNCLATEEEVL